MALDGTKEYTVPGNASLGEHPTNTHNREELKYKFTKFIKEWTSGKSFIYR